MADGELLLIARDWQSRTLLLAELQEAGYEVNAQDGLNRGLAAMASPHAPVTLIVIDLFEDPAGSPDTLQALMRLVPEVPVVLIAGTYQAPGSGAPDSSRIVAMLHRPVSVGEIVNEVRRILPLPPPG